ncbi:MAG: hypothetical protein JRS35_19985 [Deltaproteobacteria bacterium]|nr:hypothetical protein [Deltaproteobacteria bacterium]
MFSRRAIVCSVGLAVLFGCAGVMPPPPPPVQAPANGDASLLAIKVHLDRRGGTERVYFVRIEEGDPLSQEAVIPSNYFEDGYVYLLNASPGRYAAVAAATLTRGSEGGPSALPPTMTNVGGGVSVGGSVGAVPQPPTESIGFLPEGSIEATVVEVKRGSVAFMGEWVFRGPWYVWIGDIGDDADAAQLHYAELLKAQKRIGVYHDVCAELKSDRTAAAWRRFLATAQERLAGTDWMGILDPAVAAPPPE